MGTTWLRNRRVSSSSNFGGPNSLHSSCPLKKDRPTSSKESTDSPDEKRTKEGAKSTYTAEIDNEVFEALGLGKKIEIVLKKLEKLDVIESCLNQVYTSIASIEATICRIDSEVQVLNEKNPKIGQVC